MATTTPNYGWVVPTSTDLVKDGATAIETLGDSIDASFVGLKGGTTGQVLSKTSGTDLAFTWSAAAASGLTLVTSTTISAAAAKSVNSCFSATYQNYLIKFVLESATSSNVESSIRLRASGTDASTNYVSQRLTAGTNNLVDAASIGTTLWFTGVMSNAATGAVSIEIARPFNTSTTQYTTVSSNANQGGFRQDVLGGINTNSTSYDGFTLSFNENVTGTIRVYGYQNS
jgi:hypothetical protein